MSFKDSRNRSRDNSAAAPLALGEIGDPYWGRPGDGLDDVPLSARRERPASPHRSLEDMVPDLKLWGTIKHHFRDWLVIILCVIIDVILNVIHPFYRFVGIDNINQVKLPHKKETVPLWSVPLIALGIPLAVFIVFLLKRRDTRDFHHAVLGLFTAVGVAAVFTDALKNGVGRARPDFFYRCFPDGIPFYSEPYQEVRCTGEAGMIREGHKSFPSGHTSWVFAGLGYLSLYLAGKVTFLDRRGYSSRILFVFFPLLAAAMVAVSRVSDYRHHWQDVTVGALLGLSIAYFSYKQHFPNFSDESAGYPFPHIHRIKPQPHASRPNPDGWNPSSQPPLHARANGNPFDLEAGRL